MSYVRSQSALDAMERRRVLTPRQAAAGRRLAATYALGVLGLKAHKPVGAPVMALNGLEGRLGASEDYRASRDALTARLWPVVWLVVCDDRTVQEVATARRENATATMALLKLALDELADHFSLPEVA